MSIGQKVIYTLDNKQYLGIIIMKDLNTNLYTVSIEGLGKVIITDGSDIEEIK